ncbi:MAG TPA: fibronectin type III domain-containing protein [Terracidiphilus sp.]
MGVSLSGTSTSASYEINLTWQAPTNSPVTIAGFKVYRTASGTSSWSNVSSLNTQTAFADMNVQSGQKYDYYVTSVDSSGMESSPSNTTTVAVP